MNPNLLLLLYVVPMVIGLLFMTSIGASMGRSLSSRYEWMNIERRRHMFGLNLVLLVGFAISVHTAWIGNKISEGASVCASASLFSCDDVIGNPLYNTDPFFGIPWGMLGMITFAGLLFLSNSVSREPDALWAEQHVNFGFYITSAGLAVIALLISYEIEMEKICQYCTTAHAANIVALFGFWKVRKMHEAGTWNDDLTESVASN
ncbi:MAG: hypothetical protein DWC07_06505 [Candidatus Poseidoniales archaeon]|nr:MAG: hypothetical protein DWC07_06505 [Candidatus Poseidoniales archaeon]